ncbi:MAG: RNA-2',3'-PO4:RNA-5'-OH ligase [uncultured Adhaeribacter sp.]|uniref:3'-phosphate/5'-hydroxy nucleic acid ligase n=1 Tax=uncultured Adhaeribacter sp. TaxID=448109 RepID=A0A6J4IGT9_9BACT|nr:MAG: RNA-2',3'-PO4:RNA-5'-OH ligase [uncultured Adhaeribacter sp.]
MLIQDRNTSGAPRGSTMARKKITGHDLMELGFPAGKVIGLTISLMQKHYTYLTAGAQLELLKQALQAPQEYQAHAGLSEILTELVKHQQNFVPALVLQPTPKPYGIFGTTIIETDAREQMDLAMRLPVAVAGALMPDAHKGHGLPIGGVLATHQAVIPYAVGMDIACRMHFTLYNIPATVLEQKKLPLRQALAQQTRFGVNTGFEKPQTHEVFDRPEFNEIKILRQLKTRAAHQLGSSGTGNHFVEFGAVNLPAPNEFGLSAGEYLGILSHSGARSLGKNIAAYYTQIAMDTCRLPVEAKYLAWLDLQTQAGQEYWRAMQVADAYARACHEQIHARLSANFGEAPVLTIDSPHNFAWQEQYQGREVIVHRKGAGKATAGALNIIPGSMTQPGYLVRGLGKPEAIYSSSHGAGRALTARQATQVLYQTEMNNILKAFGVELMGGSLQESPMAYKNMHHVMESQQEQVEILGTFAPRIIRMDRF